MTISKLDKPAFPSLDAQGYLLESGLTKRELFAAMALQGLLANPATDGERDEIAFDAVMYADELISELNKTSGSGK